MAHINLLKGRFNKTANPFTEMGVSALNCFVGMQSKSIRKHYKKVDYESRFTNDRSLYVMTKNNVDGLRR